MYYPSQNIQQNGFTNNYSAFPGVFCYETAPTISFPPFDISNGNDSTTDYSNLPSSSFTTSSNTKSSKVEVTSSSFAKNETQTKSENVIPSEMDELPVKSVESVSSALLKFIDSIKSSREESSPKTEEPCF
uniref:Uncharacterized protein n=1 Tax=Panagrolaimus davidi TaxID=227884 RepID=A0A914QCF1_9BILA